MGLFNKNPNEAAYVGGKKHWADVIKNSGPGELLIWRQPEEDFNTNSTLIVMPGEEAIFMNQVEDKNIKKKVEKAYDTLHSSPVRSNNTARDYELTVMDLIEVLEQNIERDDLIAASTTLDKILKNADERNRRVRLGN